MRLCEIDIDVDTLLFRSQFVFIFQMTAELMRGKKGAHSIPVRLLEVPDMMAAYEAVIIAYIAP